MLRRSIHSRQLGERSENDSELRMICGAIGVGYMYWILRSVIISVGG